MLDAAYASSQGLARGSRFPALSTKRTALGYETASASRMGAARVETVVWGAHTGMTENERRSRDILTREDVLVRGMAVIALIATFLLLLLVMNP